MHYVHACMKDVKVFTSRPCQSMHTITFSRSMYKVKMKVQLHSLVSMQRDGDMLGLVWSGLVCGTGNVI